MKLSSFPLPSYPYGSILLSRPIGTTERGAGLKCWARYVRLAPVIHLGFESRIKFFFRLILDTLQSEGLVEV